MSQVQTDLPESHPYRPFHIAKLDIHWLRYVIMLVLLGLAVHLLLPQIAGLDKALAVLKTMSPWLIILAVIMQMGSYVGSGLLLQGLVRLAGAQLSLGRTTVINLAASSIGLVAVGVVGSSAAIYNWIRGDGVSAQGAGLAATLKTVFNVSLLLLLSIIGLVHLILIHDLSTAQITGFIFTLVLLLLIAWALISGARNPKKLAERLHRLADGWAKRRGKTADSVHVERIVNQLQNAWLILSHDGWQRPLLGSALNTGFDILTLYVLFIAAGQNITLGVLLTGYGLPLLLGKVSFLPGGVGIVEATMTAIYTSLGISSATVVVVILGYRLLSFWIPMLFGFPLAIYLQRMSQARQAATVR